MQESASFWTDIKNLEERLEKAPDSFCFARLSDVYLKVGLIDDALYVARQGVAKHPRYLSGQRALSQACYARGLNDEAMAALLLVTEALPEDVASQKLLGRLLSEAGNQEAAGRAFRIALEFAPDDVESRIELESLERAARITGVFSEPEDDSEEIIEDLEIFEEIEIIEDDDYAEAEFPFPEVTCKPEAVAAPRHDPLSTGTLAELYVKQGFIQKALEIYRAIVADNPADMITTARISELELLESGPVEPDELSDDTFETEPEDEPVFRIPPVVSVQEFEPAIPEPVDEMPLRDVAASIPDTPWFGSAASSALPPKGSADNALATFNGWLENIRKIKSCR